MRALLRRPARPTIYLWLLLALQSFLLQTKASALATTYPASGHIAAGHQMLAHAVHGGALVSLVKGLPGAPLLAPAGFALADRAAGAIGVAILALGLLAGATAAAYSAAKRFQGPTVGLIAAGIFAACLVTTGAGTGDVFEPVALCALAWAVTCALRFARGDGRNLLLGGVALLVAADYAQYQATWWDLLVLALLVRVRPEGDTWIHGPGWNAQRFALLAAVLLVVCLLAGRAPYFDAIAAALTPAGRFLLIVVGWFAAVGLALLARSRDEPDPDSSDGIAVPDLPLTPNS